MKTFAHFNASNIEEVVSLLNRYQGKAALIAGGTDILGKMKDRILPTYPEALINIKTIPGLDEIREENGFLKVGPLAILEDIAHNATIKSRYSALAEAARRTASPHLREMGTIGGNICQDIRCWYYRNPENRFPCLRKGGGRCYALKGDTRYHSIFGGSVEEGCIAVHPSDTAPALIALDAHIKTSKRTVKAEDFFQVEVTRTTVLEPDEIVTEIHIPEPEKGTKSTYLKFALRKSIDFPIVNCAARITIAKGKVSAARICLNAVYVKPYRALGAEEAIIGKAINDANAKAAGNAAVASAKPLADNAYMVEAARALVKNAVLACS
ncbi:MAG: FAD binding domain-containing protein [Deltaproteobacteria bacterium]|nr:FAD binding domain-containing protein [Deltaproteobacteria bacterium]